MERARVTPVASCVLILTMIDFGIFDFWVGKEISLHRNLDILINSIVSNQTTSRNLLCFLRLAKHCCVY